MKRAVRILPLLLVVPILPAMMAACFFNGQAQGDARDNGNGNGNGNGAGNGTGNGTGNGNDNGNGNSIGGDGSTGSGPVADGDYDITAAGGGNIGGSELTINGDTVSGFIAQANEGQADTWEPGCTRTVDRTTFTMTSDGSTVQGSLTLTRSWSGSYCPADINKSVDFTGTRTAAGGNLFAGTWQLTGLDRNPVVMNVYASGGTVKITSTRADMTMAARKR